MTDKDKALSRIVGVEEHFADPTLLSRLPEGPLVESGYRSVAEPFGSVTMLDKLSDTQKRLKDLDAAGITMQLLSCPTAGAELLAAEEARDWAREFNDVMARRIAEHPERYAGLAHLPLSDPEAAADELERAVTQLGMKGALVNGATNGRYLDHPAFDPVLARAAHLDVPIYLHPAPSPKPVRDALYGDLPNDFGFFMSISGWGWHADTAVHVLRLMLTGAFQRHPNLKVIIGHLGEGLQVMLPRLDQQFHDFAGFDGVPSDILRRHVWVSFGGFYTLPSFQAALDAFGPDRLLFSVDYPYGSPERGRAFLEQLPVDPATLAKITHGNADRLLKLAA